MAKFEHGRTGVTMNLTPDSKHGVVSQDPQSTLATAGGISDVSGKIEVGVPYTIRGRIGSDSYLAGSTATTLSVFNKDCPHKLRIMRMGFVTQTMTLTDWGDADGGNLDLKVEHGDGAASESFNDILASQTLDDDFDVDDGNWFPNGTVNLDQTYCVVDEGESIKITLTADPDDTTVDSAATYLDMWFEVVRIM